MKVREYLAEPIPYDRDTPRWSLWLQRVADQVLWTVRLFVAVVLGGTLTVVLLLRVGVLDTRTVHNTSVDCAAFALRDHAQAVYDAASSSSRIDLYNLDTDGDGKACEGLPE